MNIFETYLVLQAEMEDGSIKQVLCLKDNYDPKSDKPKDFFVGSPKNAKIIGEVTLDGTLEGHALLENSYTSD